MEKKRIWHCILLAVCIILGAGAFSGKAEAAQKAQLNRTSIKLTVNKKFSLKLKHISKKKIKKVAYQSSKKSVARVSSNGRITAKKAGRATVTCRVVWKNKKKIVLKCKVKVVGARKQSGEGNHGKKQATAKPDDASGASEHGNSGNNGSETTPNPEPTVSSAPQPISSPAPKPTPKYEYGLEVLNTGEELYNTEEQIVIVHVITDNPDLDTFTVQGITERDDWTQTNIINLTTFFKDIRWLGSEHQVGLVSDGYIFLGSFNTAGKKEIGVCEGEEYSIRYSDTYTYYGYKYTIPTNATISLNIGDCDAAWERYCHSVIDQVCDNDMDDYEKIYNICNFVKSNFTYYSCVGENDGTTSLLREWAEPGFVNKKTECGKSANLVQRFCELLGLESDIKVVQAGESYSENGGWGFALAGHRVNVVTIDGQEYVFDASPPGNTAKEYTEEEIEYII